MSQFTDKLSDFYGINDNAWKNVQWHYASRAEYLLTRSAVKDTMWHALNNGEMPSAEHSAVVLTSKRIAWAHAELLSVQDTFSAFQRAKEVKLLKQKHDDNEKRINIISNKRLEKEKRFGEIEMNAKGSKFIAKDILGRKITESLIIYYEGEEEFQVKAHVVNSDGTEKDEDPYTTKIVAIADLSPRISMQSGKNLILTTVQGRDYTRKELVSGGDITFSVSGVIASQILDSYPDNDVKKFINIMEYGGIVNVNNMFFDQFNVDRILIKDWRLDAQECKNIQPYSFTCVAVEPETDVVIKSDTIDLINYKISESGVDGIVSVALDKKWSSFKKNLSDSADWAERAAGYDFSLADIIGKFI